jgi:hypothetical protein
MKLLVKKRRKGERGEAVSYRQSLLILPRESRRKIAQVAERKGL